MFWRLVAMAASVGVASVTLAATGVPTTMPAADAIAQATKQRAAVIVVVESRRQSMPQPYPRELLALSDRVPTVQALSSSGTAFVWQGATIRVPKLPAVVICDSFGNPPVGGQWGLSPPTDRRRGRVAARPPA